MPLPFSLRACASRFHLYYLHLAFTARETHLQCVEQGKSVEFKGEELTLQRAGSKSFPKVAPEESSGSPAASPGSPAKV